MGLTVALLDHLAGALRLCGRAVIQHITSVMGADRKITLEIQADLSDCISDNVAGTVTENAHTLKLRDFGLEEERNRFFVTFKNHILVYAYKEHAIDRGAMGLRLRIC